jgi:hypothetical protein
MPPNPIAELAIRHSREVVSKIVARGCKYIECRAKWNTADQKLTRFLHGLIHTRRDARKYYSAPTATCRAGWAFNVSR